MQHRLPAIALLLIACTEPTAQPDAPLVDTSPPVTSCANPVPTTATPTVVASGVVGDDSLTSGTALGDAMVGAFHATGGGSLGAATSEASGIYQLTATTNQLPIDNLTFAKAGYVTSRYFPRIPLARTSTVPRLPVFTAASIAAFATDAGVTQPATAGVAIVFVNDCSGGPITNATVALSPPGTSIVKYLKLDGTFVDTATDSTGIAFIFAATTGDAVLTGTGNGKALSPRALTIDPSATALVTISEL